MAAEATETTDVTYVATNAVPSSRPAGRGDTCLRYRLDVIAGSVGDVVQSAGGWLYDRVAAGWDVNVVLPHAEDARALQILGVRVLELEPVLNPGAARTGLALSADAVQGDPRIRETLHKALAHCLTEVTVWGGGWQTHVDRATTAVGHPLSAAARMFKRHALAAAGIAISGVASAETFRSDLGTHLPVASDLVPLSNRTGA